MEYNILFIIINVIDNNSKMGRKETLSLCLRLQIKVLLEETTLTTWDSEKKLIYPNQLSKMWRKW